LYKYYFYPAFYYLKEQFNIEFSNTKLDDEINILKTEKGSRLTSFFYID